MTSFCCSAFIMSSTTFNYEPLKTSQPWLAVTPARGVGFLGILGGGMPHGSPNSDPTLDQILETLRSNDADDNENVKKNNRFN